MGFIEDYKQLMYSLLDTGNYEQAKLLQTNVRKLANFYDEEMCYLEALVAYSEYHFPIALFWAEKGYQMNSDYAPIKKLIEILYDQEIDFSNYQLVFPSDVSFLNKKLRIVIHCGLLPYMDYVVGLFKEIFESLGHEVFLYRHDDENIYEQFQNYLTFGVDGSICFNNAGWFLSLCEFGNLCEYYHIPNLNYLYDHPFFYDDSMKSAPSNGIVSCVDQKHSNYIKKFYPNVKQTFFFPLGGDELPLALDKAWKDRSIEVLYVGTLKLSADFPNDDFSTMAIEKLTKNTYLTTDEAIIELFQSLSNDEMELYFPEYADCVEESKYNDMVLRDVVKKYCKIDLNVNSIYRAGAVMQLAGAGIPVTVYGGGWDDIASTNENIHYMGTVSAAECVEKICDTKIVLNSMPWFKEGFHDRIANAMLNRAVCVTDPSEYTLQRFTDGEDIVYYSLDHMDMLPSIVLSILNDEKKAEYIIENAYKKARFTETWQNRGMEYLHRLMNNDFS